MNTPPTYFRMYHKIDGQTKYAAHTTSVLHRIHTTARMTKISDMIKEATTLLRTNKMVTIMSSTQYPPPTVMRL